MPPTDSIPERFDINELKEVERDVSVDMSLFSSMRQVGRIAVDYIFSSGGKWPSTELISRMVKEAYIDADKKAPVETDSRVMNTVLEHERRMRQILQEEGILNMDDNSQKGKGKERQT